MGAGALTAGMSYNYLPVGVSRLIRRDGVTPTMSPDRDRPTTSLGRQTNGTAGIYQQPEKWGASAAACKVSKPIRHKVVDMEFTTVEYARTAKQTPWCLPSQTSQSLILSQPTLEVRKT